MIRWSDNRLCLQCHVCFVILFAMAGCDKVTPSGTGNHSSTSPIAELNHDVDAEPTAEVTASRPSAATDDAAQIPSTSEQIPTPSEQPPAVSAPATIGQKKTKVALSVPPPPEYVYEPQVLMSQRDADSCLVKVGDAFPAAELADLEGQQHALKELLGEKLTVVVFWANSNRLGREQVQRLKAETVLPFENTGLNVIAINISDPAEQISDLLPADGEVSFTVLLDADASLFSKIATGGQPRTYLLDASGNVLWFDIEYSRSMARNLANAIHVYLGDGKVGDS